MPNIFSKVEDNNDEDNKVIKDESELLTDNEDEDEDNIEQYNIATIKCIRRKN